MRLNRAMISRALILALCAGVVACSSGVGGDGSCTRSADCPSGNVCVSQRCLAPSATCTTDTDCAATEFCNGSGECEARRGDAAVTPPNADAMVTPPTPDAAPIDPDGGPGPEPDAAPVDPDGGPGPQPDAGPACATDPDCAPPSTICVANACVAGCAQNPALCSAAEVCNTTTGRCAPRPTTCTMDSQCGPPARVCESTQCVPGCGQAGGVQCAGMTPVCSPTTGRCEPVPPCSRDSDCGNPDQICVNTACVLRCDRPGAAACAANTVCNAADGRCIPGNLALGADCALDSQCTSRLCLGLNINMSARQVCSQTCGRSLDCPVDFGCLYLSGTNFCLSENLFTPPAAFDTRAGGSCSTANITCQSGWCNTQANQCIESCSREADCSAFGGNCFTYTQTPMGSTTNLYDNICVTQTNSVIGATCATNTTCRTGVCNRYASQCAAHCCSDADCPVTQVCGLYDLDTTTGDIIKICGPRSPGAGALPIGSPCTMPEQCDSEVCTASTLAMGAPLVCSTLCCTNADCAAIPNGRCVPGDGPVVGTVQTIVGICVSVP